MPKSFAKLRIHAAGAGTILDAIETLRSIENAYLQIYATNIYFDAITDTFWERTRPLPFSLLEMGFAPWNRGIGHLSSPAEIRSNLLIAEDQLRLSAVQFQSPGFWEVLGSMNPIEQLRRGINDRHERQKDRDFRNPAEKRRLELENERLAVEVFESKVEALRKMGYSSDEIQRMLIPVTKAFHNLAVAQDQGLIGTAEIRSEDRQKKD